MSAKKSLAEVIEDTIDRGATTVEEIHKSIADMPLKVLEETELLREPARRVRRMQDRTIGAIYDVIRDVNEKVGGFARRLGEEVVARRGGESAQPHKHAAHAH